MKEEGEEEGKGFMRGRGGREEEKKIWWLLGVGERRERRERINDNY